MSVGTTYLAMARKSGVSHPTILRQCKGRSASNGKIKFVEVKIDDKLPK